MQAFKMSSKKFKIELLGLLQETIVHIVVRGGAEMSTPKMSTPKTSTPKMFIPEMSIVP